MENRIGQVIKGYELQELVGKGGFGAIYRALQSQIEREVAVKIILPDHANKPEFIRRFEFEAQLVARLEHPHIVPLYDYWRDPDGAYLIMRWLRGGTLRAALEIIAGNLNLLVRIIDQVTSALMVAHRNGVIHRDMKPDNILLDEDGNAYLADFGIAIDLAETDGNNPDVLIGSPAYLAPEQVRGQLVSPQTDLYSLGIVLFELLTGEQPFTDSSPTKLLFKHLNDPLPSLFEYRPDFPEALELLLQRATAKDPDARYDDAATFAAALREAIGREASAFQPIGHPASTSIPDSTLPDFAIPSIANPYKGLRAFQEADAVDFYGRESLIARLLERMSEDDPLSRFLALVGPSGGGKSSVIRAGLVPALRNRALPDSDDWFIADMFPGTSPMKELETALLSVSMKSQTSLIKQLTETSQGLRHAVEDILPRDDQTELLLVIDQFEEVFTQVEDEEERIHFLESLMETVRHPASRLRIIVTLRADYYDRPLMYSHFGEMLRQRTEVVLPLSQNELRRAITSPAEQVGAYLEPGLVDAILRDVDAQPGALPLMQYALTEMFDRREGSALTLAAYHDSGGVLGALARRADELYERLDTLGQETTRQIFLRLVTLGEGVEITRRRIQQSVLTSMVSDATQITPVLDAYGQFRLLTFDHDPATREPTLEVAHEALIRTWERLAAWIQTSREDLRIHQRLTIAVHDWKESGQVAGFLAHHAQLIQYENLAINRDILLNAEEKAYIEACIAHREQLAALEHARQEQEAVLEHRAAQRLRYLAAVLLIATVGAFILSAFAINQSQQAETARATSDANANLAEQQLVIAEFNAAEAHSLALVASVRQTRATNPLLALNLALEANKIEFPPAEAQLVLSQTAYAPGARHILQGHTDTVRNAVFSPDGKTALSASSDGTLILWDLQTGGQIRTFSGHTDSVVSVDFSPDGKTALSGSDNSELFLWDIETGERIRSFEGHRGSVRTVAFSPDGLTALSVSLDRDVILWNVISGTLLRTFRWHADNVLSIVYSPDGRTALSASADHTLILWDLMTGAILRTYRGHANNVTDVAFSPDGTMAISSSLDRSLILWQVSNGRILHRFTGHQGGVLSVTFTPDGQQIISASSDNTLILWDIESGEASYTFQGHTDNVRSVAINPDGMTILSASSDETVILWDLQDAHVVRTLPDNSTSLWGVAISPDGSRVLTASGFPENAIKFMDASTGEVIHTLREHSDTTTSVRLSRDGTRAISTSVDRKLILWDIDQGKAIQFFEGHSNTVWDSAFHPDGNRILSVSGDQTLILWDTQTRQAIRSFSGHTGSVNSVDFHPDGELAISGSSDQTLILWNTRTGDVMHIFEGHNDRINSVRFSPDGQQVLSASDDATLMLWDTGAGKHLQTFQGHRNAVQTAVFSPDGTRILSGSSDHSLILWESTTGQILRLYTGQADRVWQVAFSPNGREAISVARDGKIIVWRIDTLDSLVEWVRQNRSVHEFTCEERILYRIPPYCTD